MGEPIPSSISTLLSRAGVVRTESVGPGMSGAQVFRCHLNDAECWALKRWPADSSPDRVDRIHRTLRIVREAGCDLVPELWDWSSGLNYERPKTRQTVAGKHWEMMRWLPGTPIDPSSDPNRIAAGAAAIARFHRSIAEQGSSWQPPPAIDARLSRLAQLDDVVQKLTTRFHTKARLDNLAETVQHAVLEGYQLLSLSWPAKRIELANRLRRHQERPRCTQTVLRDVHRGHVLFQQSRVTGLVDFDAIRVDTPWTDIARWAGDFLHHQQDEQKVWESVLAGYRRAWPSFEQGLGGPEELLSDLHFANTWIGLVNWLDWIMLQGRHFEPPAEQIAGRLRQLIQGASKSA